MERQRKSIREPFISAPQQDRGAHFRVGGEGASLAIRTESPTKWVSVREEEQRNGRGLGCKADRHEEYEACDDDFPGFFPIFFTKNIEEKNAAYFPKYPRVRAEC